MKISKEELISSLGECDKGNHKWRAISRTDQGYGEEHVVRWCGMCGCIVIDIDVDNRVAHLPGGVMKIRGPIVARAYKGLIEGS